MKKTSVVLSLFLLMAACKEQTNEVVSEEIISDVITKTIKPQEITRYHEIPAVLKAENRADLSFQLSGTVDKVLIKIGEKIKKNQVLMGLFNPNLSPELELNLAGLESIKTKISQAERDVVRLKQLRKNNSTSQNALEKKETELKDLNSQSKVINVRIALAQANQRESFIRAPYDGVIVDYTKEVGEFVRSGEKVISVFHEGSIEVKIELTKNLRKNLSSGDKISGVYEGKEVSLTVVELSIVADLNSHLTPVILKVDTLIEDAIGQEIILFFPQVYSQVYKLPLEVVVDDGINKPYVFINNLGVAEKVRIQPMYSENGEVIFQTEKLISKAVIVKGQSKIFQGARIQQKQ